MIAAGDDEKAALAEVDSILERMGLRAKQPTVRPLSDRIAGSRRIARRLHLFLGLAIVLFSLLALLPPGAEF
jgi:ferric-dicitrate binding protein FerR (iron transport regulator)